MPPGNQSNVKVPPSKPPQPKKQQPKIPASNLIIWWPLDDATHTSDAAGTESLVYKQALITNRFTSASNWGALTCPTTGTHRYDPLIGGYCYNNNKGLHLSSVVGVPEMVFLNYDANLPTVSVWAYITANPGAAYGAVVHRDEGGNTNISIRAVAASTSWALAYTSGGVAKTVTAPTVYALNRWYHLVAVYDTTITTSFFYINGEVVGSVVGAPDVFGTNAWKIGNSNANDRNFAGYIWNCMMFKRALKGSEIKEMFLNPLEVFTVLEPPIVLPEVPVVPPVGTVGAAYTVLVGRPATPIPTAQQIISNNSGPKPML